MVAWVPAAGPVPPPTMVVTPETSASSACCGTDPVNMGIDPAGGDDLAFGGNHFRRGADGDGDVGLDIGITGFADGEDPPVLHADIGLDDPQ